MPKLKEYKISFMEINRAFTRIEEGEIHYRYSGNESNETIYMIHSSPASSVILLPLMVACNPKLGSCWLR